MNANLVRPQEPSCSVDAGTSPVKEHAELQDVDSFPTLERLPSLSSASSLCLASQDTPGQSFLPASSISPSEDLTPLVQPRQLPDDIAGIYREKDRDDLTAGLDRLRVEDEGYARHSSVGLGVSFKGRPASHVSNDSSALCLSNVTVSLPPQSHQSVPPLPPSNFQPIDGLPDLSKIPRNQALVFMAAFQNMYGVPEKIESRPTSLQESVDVFNDVILCDIWKKQETDPKLPFGQLKKNRSLPHTISPDEVMIQECPQVAEWIKQIMGKDYCVSLKRDVLTDVKEKASKQNYDDKKGIEAFLRSNVLGGILPDVVHALAQKMVQLKKKPQSLKAAKKPWQKLNEMLPGIPWESMAKKKFEISSTPVDSIIQRTASRSWARWPDDLTKVSEDRQDTLAEDSDEDADADSSSNLGHSQKNKPYHPSTSRLRTDFFFNLQDSNNKCTTFHLGEVKAYSVGNSKRLRNFFEASHYGTKASSEHNWRSMVVSELAKVKKVDRQSLAGASQCMNYIVAHCVPFEVLTTGQTIIFFRIDHTRHLKQSNDGVDLLYYVVSGLSGEGEANGQENNHVWEPVSPCLAFVYSFLRGISAACTTPNPDCIAWSNNLWEALPTVAQLGSFPTAKAMKQKGGKGMASAAEPKQDDNNNDKQRGPTNDKGLQNNQQDQAGRNGRRSGL